MSPEGGPERGRPEGETPAGVPEPAGNGRGGARPEDHAPESDTNEEHAPESDANEDRAPESGAHEGGAAPGAPSPVRTGVLVGAAVGVFGVAFGVLARSSGLSVAQACAMSLLVFTGASQFAAVGVVGGGGSAAAALVAALLLAARNALYGAVVSRWMRYPLPLKLLAAHLTIDESAAVSSAQPNDRQAAKGFWAAGVAVFAFWNLGTLVGALGGGWLGDPEALGLDAAFPAGFVALMVPHLRHRPGQVAALAGAALAIACVPLLPAGLPILVAALAVVPATVVALRSDPGGAPARSLPPGAP